MVTKAVHKVRLPPLPTVSDIIRLYKLRALKQLSQNFLLDLRVTDKIVRAAGNIRDGEVVEVGPGPGSITRSIINRNPGRVFVIEKDRRFVPALEMLSEASPFPIEIITGDVLSFNMEKLFKEEYRKGWHETPPNIHLIGNLPFSVSTHLIIKWLQNISEKANAWKYGRVPMTLTFQKEVAERMTAGVMSKQRCRLSVMCQNWCYVQHKFNIGGSAFVPKPDVDVGVVHLTPLQIPIIDLPFKLVEKVVRCIFSFRQKYSIRGAETLFPHPLREKLSTEMYSQAQIDITVRPFQLTVPEIGRLCHAYNHIILRQPSLASYNARGPKTEQLYDYVNEGDIYETQDDTETSSEDSTDLRKN